MDKKLNEMTYIELLAKRKQIMENIAKTQSQITRHQFYDYLVKVNTRINQIKKENK